MTVPVQARAIVSPTRGQALGEGFAEGPFLESFRLLALNIDHMLKSLAGRSILVLSALPGDGRTLTAASLARALYEIRPPVLLMDSDPFDARENGPKNGAENGALSSDHLSVERRGSSTYRSNGHPDLYTYTPPAGLSAKALFNDIGETLAQAAKESMTVVIDSPPCVSSTIAFGLAPMVSGVVYVARPGTGRRPAHGDIRTQLDRLGANVLGVVVNEG